MSVALGTRRAGWLLGLLAAIPLGLTLVVIGVLQASQSSQAQSAPSSAALADIPPLYLALYEAAGQKYGLDWAILAGIGKVECDHGRNPDPACSQTGAVNSAGAGGPAQFLAATWAIYGVTPNGTRAPPDGRWRAPDAIFSMANYLRASGAPADYPGAIWAYNHSSAYVAEVQSWAAQYRAAQLQVMPIGQTVPGQTARITAQGYALAPAGAPPAVQALLAAGNQIINSPYPSPDVHYGPLNQPWPAYDCSGATSYVLYRAGLHSVIAETSGQLERYGNPGPGRWVTVYANPGHVFVAVAGVVMNTAWYAPVQPTTPPSGPRWQPASTIAAQVAGDHYGGFVERHPAGL